MNSHLESNDPLGDKVLVLEDDPVTARLVTHILGKHGFQVEVVDTQDNLISSLSSFQPQVVVLDNVPNLPCSKSCAMLKSGQLAQRLNIVVYSGISDEVSMVELIKIGADRVIPKIFSPAILAAELTALLRISILRGDSRKKLIEINELSLDPKISLATYQGINLKLTQSEFKVLYILATLVDRVVSREEIIAFLHRDGFQTSDRLSSTARSEKKLTR